MANNSDTAVARRFHGATKYVFSPADDDILMGEGPNPGRALGEQDLAIEPAPFKIYPSLDPIPLPRPSHPDGTAALEAIAASGRIDGEVASLDLDAVALLMLRSNGILKEWQNPAGKELFFRAAGCTGARYHLELYLVAGPLDGLDAGVYHYDARAHALKQLRSGDFRGNVVAATGGEPAVAAAPAIVVCTSTFWRNAWRYQERAYRHVYWDTGTLFTSFLAVAADLRQPAEVVLGFADAPINRLLDVDGEREAAVALIALGRAGKSPPTPAPVEPLHLPTNPVSAREIDFPLIREMHRASELATGAEAAAWRRPLVPEPPTPTGTLIELTPLADGELPAESIEAVILRRRSNRYYDAKTPLPFPLFSTALVSAGGATAMDALAANAPPLHGIYLILNNVEGLPPGSYVYHPERQAIELLAAGDQREAARELACGQEYAGQAHVNVYLLTDLRPVLAHYGNRGYRLAQLDAALFGGKVQLAAHALGLGAVGSTSADDAVIAHFSPHAAGKSFMFIAVFGIRRKPTETERDALMRFFKREE